MTGPFCCRWKKVACPRATMFFLDLRIRTECVKNRGPDTSGLRGTHSSPTPGFCARVQTFRSQSYRYKTDSSSKVPCGQVSTVILKTPQCSRTAANKMLGALAEGINYFKPSAHLFLRQLVTSQKRCRWLGRPATFDMLTLESMVRYQS